MLYSKKANRYPAKDAVYRFLDQPTFNWRRFLLSFDDSKSHRLTNRTPKVFIVEDSVFDLNRIEKAELLNRCFNRTSQKMKFYKWFLILTDAGLVGRLDIHAARLFLRSSMKAQLNGISADIDTRTSSYKSRMTA